MQVGGKLGELRPCTLFLALLLFSSDLSVVIVKVATNLLILGLHVLQVLLASIEIVLPSSAVVSTVAIQKTQEDVSVCLLGVWSDQIFDRFITSRNSLFFYLQFLDYSCHLCVVGHLASLIPTLIHSIDS